MPYSRATKWPRRSIAVCALAAAFAAPAFPQQSNSSQQQLKQLSLEQLGDVEVTTQSKAPEQVWQTPCSDLRDHAGRHSALREPQAYRKCCGWSRVSRWRALIRPLVGGYTRIRHRVFEVRAGAHRRPKRLQHLLRWRYWDVQNVMLEDVDRIEVIRGPGGTIWGANAVNGVINIITKNSEGYAAERLAAVSGGNVDQGMGSFRYGGGNGKNFNFRIYGMAFGRAAEFHPDHVNFDEWQMGQGGFRTDFAIEYSRYPHSAGRHVQGI